MKNGQQVRLARSHYAASHGQQEAWGEVSGPSGGLGGDVSKVADGPFYRNSRVRLADITDGLSSTILVGEHSSRLSDKAWAGVVPGAYVHPKILTPDNSPESAATLLLVHSGPSPREVDLFGHPTIGTEAFQLAKALDNACNLRDHEQLPKARALVEAAHGDGTISDSERRILTGIVKQAEDGEWERAAKDVRKLLAAQQRSSN